jgi:hypothetical protein
MIVTVVVGTRQLAMELVTRPDSAMAGRPESARRHRTRSHRLHASISLAFDPYPAVSIAWDNAAKDTH